MFYVNPTDGNSLEDYRRNDPLTPEELRDWKIALEARYLLLKQRDIQYLFVVAPDTKSIYGEYYPSRIRPAGKQSRLDQLLEYMQGSEVPILDLRPPLLQAKTSGQLYFKTNTHWNDFGAAVAQYEIMRYFMKFYPALSPIVYGAEAFSWIEFPGGDIADMLNLSSRLKEIAPRLRVQIPSANPDDFQKRELFTTDCRADAPRALIFCDSFFIALQPYISQYFSKTLYVWERPDFNQLEKYLDNHTPDIVIEERVERSLKHIPALPTFGSSAESVGN